MSHSPNVGDRASVTRTFDQANIADFANLVGVPATEIAHVPDPLIAGLFSFLLGVKVPGPGTNYLKQNLVFLAPAPIGVPLTATVEITRLRPEKHLCDLATTCVDAQARTICTGRALVLIKDVAKSDQS